MLFFDIGEKNSGQLYTTLIYIKTEPTPTTYPPSSTLPLTHSPLCALFSPLSYYFCLDKDFERGHLKLLVISFSKLKKVGGKNLCQSVFEI